MGWEICRCDATCNRDASLSRRKQSTESSRLWLPDDLCTHLSRYIFRITDYILALLLPLLHVHLAFDFPPRCAGFDQDSNASVLAADFCGCCCGCGCGPAAAWTHLAWGTVTTAGSRSRSNRSEARSVPFLRSCKHASVDAGYALVPCHKRRYMIDLFVTDVIPSVICYLFGPTQQYKVYASGVFRKIWSVHSLIDTCTYTFQSMKISHFVAIDILMMILVFQK